MDTENKKKQILIVDDEEVNREILKEMFRDGQYELLEAEDGEEAISKLKSNDRIVLVSPILLCPSWMASVCWHIWISRKCWKTFPLF